MTTLSPTFDPTAFPSFAPTTPQDEQKQVWQVIIEWLLIVLLVVLSGLFSGLNLGLMGLDPIGLQIVMASDNESNAASARKIQPLRKHGNWLLCTLLIGNVAVNAALSILLADKTTGTIGFFVSTATITVFGEIIPQALCSRYALEVGSRTIWIVWPLMWLMAIIAWPISYVLDKILGDELGTVYSNKELQKLVDIHAEIEGTGVGKNTAQMLRGALGLRDALVLNCMTEMKDVFWLNDQSKLSFDVLTEIFKSGHSRIPIFNTQDKFGRIACVGLLYVKDLILLDPDDEMPVTQIMNAFKHKTPPIVWKDDTLQHLLEIFVKTSQHLAFVQDVVSKSNDNVNSNTIAVSETDAPIESKSTVNLNRSTNNLDNSYEYVGIITLEDVIEHVLQTQLIDEHDNFVDNKHMLRTNRLNRIDWNMLHIFDHRQRVLTTLPPQELQAVYHFLSQTIKPFTPKNRLVSEASIKNLLATSSVLRVVTSQDDQIVNSKFGRRIQGTNIIDNSQNITQRDPYKDIEDNGLLLYQRDKKTKYFTLLLDGKCEIYAGRQGFRCELTRWSYLFPHALDGVVDSYRYNKPMMDHVPDFTAKIIENSRVLRIKLDDFRACLEGKFNFDSKTNPHSPAITSHMTPGQIGFATRTSVENTQQANDLYEYPNTYHLHGTPNLNHNESKSDSTHEDTFPKRDGSRHSIRQISQIFSSNKSKHKKKNSAKKNSKYDSVNVYDSDQSSEPNHRMMLPKHSAVKPGNSAPLNTNESNSSLFAAESQPLMQSVSDPHIISHLPGAGHISDNSKQQISVKTKMPFQKHPHINPNYRLSQNNNLSNIQHPHHHFNSDDEDIRNSPPRNNPLGSMLMGTGHMKVPSHSKTEENENQNVVIEMIEEEPKTKKMKIQKISSHESVSRSQKDEGNAQKKHVYKSNEKSKKKRRTQSDATQHKFKPSKQKNNGNDQLHLYTTPNTSNVSDVFNGHTKNEQ